MRIRLWRHVGWRGRWWPRRPRVALLTRERRRLVSRIVILVVVLLRMMMVTRGAVRRAPRPARRGAPWWRLVHRPALAAALAAAPRWAPSAAIATEAAVAAPTEAAAAASAAAATEAARTAEAAPATAASITRARARAPRRTDVGQRWSDMHTVRLRWHGRQWCVPWSSSKVDPQAATTEAKAVEDVARINGGRHVRVVGKGDAPWLACGIIQHSHAIYRAKLQQQFMEQRLRDDIWQAAEEYRWIAWRGGGRRGRLDVGLVEHWLALTDEKRQADEAVIIEDRCRHDFSRTWSRCMRV